MRKGKKVKAKCYLILKHELQLNSVSENPIENLLAQLQLTIPEFHRIIQSVFLITVKYYIHWAFANLCYKKGKNTSKPKHRGKKSVIISGLSRFITEFEKTMIERSVSHFGNPRGSLVCMPGTREVLQPLELQQCTFP